MVQESDLSIFSDFFFSFLYHMTSCLVNGKARNGLTFRPVSPEPLTKDACVTKVMCVRLRLL